MQSLEKHWGSRDFRARLAEAAPPPFLSARRGAMRFVVSCDGCNFKGDATDICGFGAQINSHASTCNLAPLIALEEGNSKPVGYDFSLKTTGDSGKDVIRTAANQPDSAEDDEKGHGKHHRVLCNVLSLFRFPDSR